MTPEDIIKTLDMQPHPEGGWYKETWQKSVPRNGWVLVGCTVCPGFVFEGFEMADVGWEPRITT